MSFDRILLARILLTLVTLGYGLATVLADFNKTHATNPQWTPHARFHVVWQICSYVGFGLLALALTWVPGAYATERLTLVAIMAAIIYAAFFVAVFAMPIYGGAAYDRNGYQPFAAPVPLIAKRWDVNITAFCIQVALLAAGALALVGADGLSGLLAIYIGGAELYVHAAPPKLPSPRNPWSEGFLHDFLYVRRHRSQPGRPLI